jgi:hypothetical protein
MDEEGKTLVMSKGQDTVILPLLASLGSSKEDDLLQQLKDLCANGLRYLQYILFLVTLLDGILEQNARHVLRGIAHGVVASAASGVLAGSPAAYSGLLLPRSYADLQRNI